MRSLSQFAAATAHSKDPFRPPTQGVNEVPQHGINLDEVVGGLELSLMNQALQTSGGNKARAAELLGIKRTTPSEAQIERN